MNDIIDIAKALLELDYICIDVDKKDTYIYKMLNDLIPFIEKVSKVEKLLELYRRTYQLSLLHPLNEQIKALEEELK